MKFLRILFAIIFVVVEIYYIEKLSIEVSPETSLIVNVVIGFRKWIGWNLQPLICCHSYLWMESFAWLALSIIFMKSLVCILQLWHLNPQLDGFDLMVYYKLDMRQLQCRSIWTGFTQPVSSFQRKAKRALKCREILWVFAYLYLQCLEIVYLLLQVLIYIPLNI